MRESWSEWLEFCDVRRKHECWPANNKTTKYSAGYRKFKGKPIHKLSFKMYYGWDPEVPDHLCLNPACANPFHLEGVGRGENAGRAHKRKRNEFACNKGHSWNLENTYYTPQGHRKCRACRREGMRQSA